MQDVVELLEKRVKSRFSHRQILLFPQSDFDSYVSLAKNLLLLPDDFKDQEYRSQSKEKVWIPDLLIMCHLIALKMKSTEVQTLGAFLLCM